MAKSSYSQLRVIVDIQFLLAASGWVGDVELHMLEEVYFKLIFDKGSIILKGLGLCRTDKRHHQGDAPSFRTFMLP
jgi:hypothetical protein